MIEKRREWKSEQPEMDINLIVFIDKCGINTGMTRLYVRGRDHEYVVDYTPDIRCERFTLLSSIRATGEMIPPVFEGALNGELFKEYITQYPAPTLKTKDIVVMDSLISHKVKGVIDPIIAVGATVRCLPPYSPDLNPIEMMRSKIKAFLRKMKTGTGKVLEKAVADALRHIIIADIMGWFAEDGDIVYIK